MSLAAPVVVLNTSTKRETGRQAQFANIKAGKAVAEVIRTCLGPRAMLKMVLDPMGGIALTNDGNAILREIDVAHPAAKSIIELSRAQDENVGDGTTSVAILAGEVLSRAEPWLEKNIHPQVIIAAYKKALEDALEAMEKFSIGIDVTNRSEALKIIASSIGTKFINRWFDQFSAIAIEAVRTIATNERGKMEIDIKRYLRIEKIPGGDISESRVLKGALLNKDVTHAKMRRRIENPRIILLDCPLEYKKAESQINIEVTQKEQWEQVMRQEEDYVINLCNNILKFKPDLVITEKGLSDLAQHIFVKNNVTALRRARKTDNNRIARVSGATIVSRPEELQESDVGKDAGLFEVRKIGDEYFSFIEESRNARACTVILRGANKDVLNEIDRNLADAFAVIRNVLLDPKLVPGGGAIELAVSQALMEKSNTIEGIQQWTYREIANALEIIPRTLAQNCGAKVVKLLTELRAKHASDKKNFTWGVDGMEGVAADMNVLGIWEPLAAKSQTIKTAIESACMLLRVDDIVSGLNKRGGKEQGGPSAESMQDYEE